MYVKGKPNPWGFKVWTLADSFGVILNIDFCVGPTPRVEPSPDIGSSSNIVLKLTSIIPDNMNYKVFTDNYFSSVPLYIEMKNKRVSNGRHSQTGSCSSYWYSVGL